MISVEAALRQVLKEAKTLPSEKIEITWGLGRVLAEDIRAGENIPGFDNSAMDGYAVKASDARGASRDNPCVLEVIRDIKAGDRVRVALKNNQAARIMTGSQVPEGADSVIMVEYTKKVTQTPNTQYQTSQYVKIFKAAEPGENIRRSGEDIRKGELVVRKGALLSPALIGLLASLGRQYVKVIRKPRVAVLATGNEVVDVGKRLPIGKIRSSNTYTLCSQAIASGGSPKNLGIARDEPGQLRKKIMQALDCDIIVTSGGVSVGDYDLVKDVLAGLGTRIRFWKVAMRPGKPLVFGRIKGIPVFGLPGNPVSSMVSFEIFVRPLILKMLGGKYERKEVEAVIEEGLDKKRGFKYFLRAITSWDKGAYTTRTTGPQGSGILKSMALANSLIILPEEKENIRKGEKVGVRFL